MAGNRVIVPFVKWAGGKRQLMPSIIEVMPANVADYTYVEPFIGGGAVLFNIQPLNAIINDLNSELINVYNVVKNSVDELIYDLNSHKNDVDYFYHIRSLDRNGDFADTNEIQRASRLIYLNKTCFNGLYRVNNAGEFNAPFGRYKKPNIVNEDVLRAVSSYLNASNVRICCGDYSEVLKELDRNAFVYLDPPYYPLSESSSFTGYTQGGWKAQEQIRLREICDELTKKGVKFLLSNSASEFIKEQYKHYHIATVRATRSINSNAAKRGEIDELLIRNY